MTRSNTSGSSRRIALTAMLLAGSASYVQAQMPQGGIPQKAEGELAHKHDGYYGALAPQNLANQRVLRSYFGVCTGHSPGPSVPASMADWTRS